MSGIFGMLKMGEEGKRLIDTCAVKGKVVDGTYFKGKKKKLNHNTKNVISTDDRKKIWM